MTVEAYNACALVEFCTEQSIVNQSHEKMEVFLYRLSSLTLSPPTQLHTGLHLSEWVVEALLKDAVHSPARTIDFVVPSELSYA